MNQASDKYRNFNQLLSSEREGIDFLRKIKKRNSGWTILAPHGGGIEPGTSEIAIAIAGSNHSLYTFEGIKIKGNKSLHITSTKFDDPKLLKLLNSSMETIVIHGCKGKEQIAYIGGRQNKIRDKIITQLLVNGINSTINSDPDLQGTDINNICNRNLSGEGIQIELSEGLRSAMFSSLTRTGRKITTELFTIFVNAVKNVIDEFQHSGLLTVRKT